MPTETLNLQEIALRYYKQLIKLRKWIILVALLTLLLVLVFAIFIAKPKYESTVSILPNESLSQSFLGQLGGVASLAGISLSPNSGGFSPELYQKTVTSESVLSGVIDRTYRVDSSWVTLFEFFKIKSDEEDSVLGRLELKEKLVEVLTEKVIDSELERLTKVLNISVTTTNRDLSRQICFQIIESLDRYMREQRKTSANNQVIYLNKRLSEVNAELINAENAIVRFQESNRNYLQSPGLVAEFGRLLRHQEIQQTIFIELTKQLELSKLEEVKDTQIINILEDPSLSARPTGMHIVLKSILIYLVLNGLFVFSLLVIISVKDKYHFTTV